MISTLAIPALPLRLPQPRHPVWWRRLWPHLPHCPRVVPVTAPAIQRIHLLSVSGGREQDAAQRTDNKTNLHKTQLACVEDNAAYCTIRVRPAQDNVNEESRAQFATNLGPVVDTIVIKLFPIEHVPKQLAQVVVIGRLEKVQRSTISQVCPDLG